MVISFGDVIQIFKYQYFFTTTLRMDFKNVSKLLQGISIAD